MRLRYLHRNAGNHRLLLVFSGWSTKPEMYADVHLPGWDTAVVHDYLDFQLTDLELESIGAYDSYAVLAWSLGVVAAENLFATYPDFRQPLCSVAVNGTPWAAHDSYGIPVNIYEGTEANLTPAALKKFRLRMASPRDMFADTYGTLREQMPEADDTEISRLKTELRTFQKSQRCYTKRSDKSDKSDWHGWTEKSGESGTFALFWHRVYIGSTDRIIPAANQERAWREYSPKTEITVLPAGHFIPLQYIASLIFPDTEKLAERFRKASSTYARAAIAQRRIAERLSSLVSTGCNPKGIHSVLELGTGQRLYTDQLEKILKPRHIVMVDLAISDRRSFADARTECIEADAEYAVGDMLSKGCKFDLVTSASTIQWFADLPRFFANATDLLNPEGHLAVSTFLPGNLGELDRIRPCPLRYYSVEELEMMLKEHFHHVEISEETITLQFNTAREALLHLKHTGVAGTSPHTVSPHPTKRRNPLGALPSPCTLTYRAAYIIASKK